MAMALISKISYAVTEVDTDEDKEWALRYLYEINGICDLAEEPKAYMEVK